MSTLRRFALWVLAALAAVSAASCVPSKAAIDRTMADGIIWPGPPEKPRIKYLWSMRFVSGGEGGSRFLRLVAGETDHDVSDPRYSDTLIAPHGVFVDGRENLYVADPAAGRVSVINLKTMDSYNITDAGSEDLAAPIGVVASPDGRIFVSDADRARVAAFNEKGKFMKSFEGEMKRPTGLALDAGRGVVYVADTWAHVIYKYSIEGARLGSIGRKGSAPGELYYPTHIFADDKGFLYVADTLNFRIQIFDPEGKLVKAFGVIGDSFDTFDKVKGIAVDTEGHIYVTDSAQNMVKIFDREGRLLLFFGEPGRFYGQFDLPAGIFIDSRNRVYVADNMNMRLQVFQFLGGN